PLRVNLIASMKYLSATNSLWPNHDFADTRPGLGGVRKYYPDFARARPLKFDFIKPSPDGPRRRLDLPGRVAPFFSIPDLHVVILRRFYAATIVVNRQLDASHFFLLPKIDLHPVGRIRRLKTRPAIPRHRREAD